tara:strand:+ start:22556 stop:24016 length:1461 start_codon:yes stop_codon:yes gene_type:complete
MKVENSKAFIWSTLNNLSKLFFSFLAPILLARILGPESFGIIAMAFVLVGLSQIFVDFGSTEAIVKSKHITTKFLSSLFWFNLLISILVFSAILLLTPFVGAYFQKPELLIIVPLLSLGMFFQVWSIVPTSIFKRDKDFKSITVCDVISRFISSILAIGSALMGAEIYSLILLSLSQTIIFCILINLLSTSKVSWYFSLRYLRLVFSFTVSLFTVKVINHVERQADRFFIGPSYGEASLGIFTRGQAFQKSIQRFINGSFNPVFFSVITRQNTIDNLTSSLSKSYQGFFVIMYPLFLYFFFFSEELVLFLFGREWESMIDLLPYFSFLFLIRPFQKVNQEVIIAKGNIYFLLACFLFYTPFLITIYFFMPDSLGLFGYIAGYIFISLLLFITTTIYLKFMLNLKSSFFFKLFQVFFMRSFVLFLVAYYIEALLSVSDFYFLNLTIFGLALILIMTLMQKLQHIEAQSDLEDILFKKPIKYLKSKQN